MAREGRGAHFWVPGVCFFLSLDMCFFFFFFFINPIFSVFSETGSEPQVPSSALLNPNIISVASKCLSVYFLVVIIKINRTCLYHLLCKRKSSSACIFFRATTCLSAPASWFVKRRSLGATRLSEEAVLRRMH